MGEIKTAEGKVVTDEMIERWEKALDHDEWPDGWVSVGSVVNGAPPAGREPMAVMSVKVPVSMKRAIERRAQNEGVSVSSAMRGLLEEGLLASGE
jgi:hypothetical protein